MRSARHEAAIAWRCVPSSDLVVDTQYIQVIALPVFDMENIQDSRVVGDPGQPCKNGKVGVCGTPSSCRTSTVTGACNGNDENVCCLRAAPPMTPSTPSTGKAGDPGQPCLNGKAGVCGTPSSCRTSTVTGACNGNDDNICCLKAGSTAERAQSAWKSAFENPKIVFNKFHPSGVIDKATAYLEAQDAAAGKPVTSGSPSFLFA